MRILLVAGDAELKAVLEGEQFQVDGERDIGSAESHLDLTRYDAVVFDVDGISTDVVGRIQAWRRSGLKSHLMVLASRLAVPMRVKLLNAGADCYVLKPNHEPELLARLRGLSRRGISSRDSTLRICDMEIDLASHSVRRAGRTIPLTPREYALLRYLALHQGRIVPRAMILEHVYEGKDESNVINVYIRYLRNKIDRGFSTPLILTRYGQGYMLRGEGMEANRQPFTLAG